MYAKKIKFFFSVFFVQYSFFDVQRFALGSDFAPSVLVVDHNHHLCVFLQSDQMSHTQG